MTINNLPKQYFNFTVTVTPVQKLSPCAKAMFLTFHKSACKKANGRLKPVSESDVLQSAFTATVYNRDNNVVGQCLLYNAQSGAEKLSAYPDISQTAKSLVITSLSGIKVASTILNAVSDFARTHDYHALYAKTSANNSTAIKIFMNAGFSKEIESTLQEDDYASFIMANNLRPSTQLSCDKTPEPATI